MKTKKEQLLEFIREYSMEYEADEYPMLTTQFLSEKLDMQRTNISSLLNQLVKDGIIEKREGRPVLYQLKVTRKVNEDEFEQMIGYDQSLKETVMLAKAAILYPQGSPHILLSAESGSGISYFTKTVYAFAVKSRILKNNAPLIVFDCTTCIENQEMMQEMIFGNGHKTGLIHEAHQGVFLMKHAELLSGYMRNILFQTFEKQNFSSSHIPLPSDYKCIFICSMPESVQQDIYHIYQSHLDYTICLPALNKRTFSERFQFIEAFLKKEAFQLNRMINVHTSVLHSLMLYECQGQVKELKNDIHNGCANSYARHRANGHSIELLLSDFPNHVRKGMIYYKNHKEQIDTIISQDCQYAFTKNEILKSSVTQSKKNIYQTIDQKKKDLKKQEISEEETNTLISLDLQKDFREYFDKLVERIESKQQLEKIVSQKLIHLVEKFLMGASQSLNMIFDDRIFFGLCLHMNASIIQIQKKQRISAQERQHLIEVFPQYYQIAQSFIKMMENEFYTQMNSDEIIFVMMFMISGHELSQQKKVVTLIAMHGHQGASSIAQTIRSLTHKEIIYGYDLPLDKSMSAAYEEFKQYITDIHQGKGIILIYDMGSMRSMAESIMSETGIEIRFLEIPVTLIGMASVNKANESCSLEETYDYLQEHFKDIQYVRKESLHQALVVISPMQSEIDDTITYLHQHFDVSHVNIYTFSGAEISDIYSEINRIANQNQIIGIISSYTLHLSQFPFLKLSELSHKKAHTVEDIFIPEDEFDDIFTYLQDQFHDMNIMELKEPLTVFLEELPRVAKVVMDDDQRIGLLIHMVCLIDKLMRQESPSVHFIASQIIISNEEMIRKVKAILKPIENKVGIHISDTEVATIISIVTKQ